MKRPAAPGVNPILLKEVRQAVRSRLISVVHCLFLLLLVVVAAGAVWVNAMSSFSWQTGATFGSGREMFHALFVPLSLVCLLFVPFHAGIRLCAERSGAHLDLQFITRLSPAAILRGKLLSSLALAGLLTSGALPFLALTFRLGGVDLPSVLLAIAVLLLAAVPAVLFALLLATVPGQILVRAGALLLGLGVLTAAVILINVAAGGIVASGLGSRLLTRSVAIWAAAVLFGVAFVCGLFFTLASARLSPPASNRSLPVRLWCTAAWAVWGAVMLASSIHGRNSEALLAWVIPSLLLSIGGLLLATQEPLAFSLRVRRGIPRRLPARMAVFPLFTGAAPGTLWALLIGLSTLGLATLLRMLRPHQLDTGTALPTLAGLLAYAFAYSQSGLLLWQITGRRHIPPWVMTLLLLTVGCVVPILFALDDMEKMATPYGAWTLGNPFALFDEVYFEPGFVFALVGCGLLLVPRLRWIVRAFRAFQPWPAASNPVPLHAPTQTTAAS